MEKLKEIQEALRLNDPSIYLNEDSEETGNLSMDNYKEAVDSSSDLEDLDFSMDGIRDDYEEIEHLEIPQQDSNREKLKVGSKVSRIAYPETFGEVIAIGELIEIQWSDMLTTMEYPEELAIHDGKDSEDLEEVSKEVENPEEPKKVRIDLKKLIPNKKEG